MRLAVLASWRGAKLSSTSVAWKRGRIEILAII